MTIGLTMTSVFKVHANIILIFSDLRILLAAAESITEIEVNAAGVKIGGSVAGLVGTGMVITGFELMLFLLKIMMVVVTKVICILNSQEHFG